MTGAVAQNDRSWSNISQSSTNGTGLRLDDVSRSLFGGRGVGMYNHNITGGLLLAAAASTSVSVSTPTRTLPDACAMTRVGTQTICCAWEYSAAGCQRFAVDLMHCREMGCNNMVHHVCQSTFDSVDDTREVPLGYIYCPHHHPHHGLGLQNGNHSGNDVRDNVDDYLSFEKEWLESVNTNNARKSYNAVITAGGTDKLASTLRLGDLEFNMQYLLTMAEGALDDDQTQMSRLLEFVNKKWLPKSCIYPTERMLSAEITCRHAILVAFPWLDFHNFRVATDLSDAYNGDLEDRAIFLKKPPTTGNKMKLKQLLDESTGRSKLRWLSEKSWIESKINKTLDTIQNFHEQQALTKHQKGELLNASKNTLMRLTCGMYRTCTSDLFLFVLYPLTLLYVSLQPSITP